MLLWTALALVGMAAAFGALLFATAAGSVARARSEARIHRGWTMESSGWTPPDGGA